MANICTSKILLKYISTFSLHKRHINRPRGPQNGYICEKHAIDFLIHHTTFSLLLQKYLRDFKTNICVKTRHKFSDSFHKSPTICDKVK